MKKQIKLFGFLVMMVAATALIAAGTQQDKEKGQKKEQQKGHDKAQKDQGKNENKGQGNSKNDDKDKTNQGNNGNGNGNNGQGNSDDKDKNNKGKNDDNGKGNNNGNGNGNGNGKNDADLSDMKWDRNSFKDRGKIKNADKVTICHKFRNNDEPAVEIRVSSNALRAHLNHGDVQGDCPKVDNTRLSDKYLKRRTDYYNELQAANEQVLYSQSILDYAKLRLLQAQQSLAATDANRYTMQQIQERQATVTNLEQNVSLLETLVGVATQLIVNKLSN